ncbi:MAG TPA: hypothetical protein VJ999_05325 [Candidatus Sulfotelmatobacter sp.]|nr:hypothetical protein [Candidatus Sulfotelmatobacter sp.]
MLTIAYLANQFPCPVEPYVGEEIEELRRRGVRVVAGSVRGVPGEPAAGRRAPEIVLQPLRIMVLLRALVLCLRRWKRISPLVARIIFRGREGPGQRVKALLHTGVGACYAVQLRKRGVGHIHAHHGYFGSWIAMTAARLLDVGFSMTLHGSDLLLHGAYLDTKLENCAFCLTVSEFNRSYLIENYPAVEPGKVMVSRLGVEVREREGWSSGAKSSGAKPLGTRLALLAVGRLHAVKDHAFLVRACAQLQAHRVAFECSIAWGWSGAPPPGIFDREIRSPGAGNTAGACAAGADGLALQPGRHSGVDQPQRGDSAGAHGSHGARQDRAGPGHHRHPGTRDLRQDGLSV